MTGFDVAPYSPEHFDGVETLWQEAFPDGPPWNKAEVAVPAKLAVQPELFLVAVKGDQVIGSIMAGYDGHRGWLYAVAVLNSHRSRGVGTALVRGAEDRLWSMGCNKINLQVRISNATVVEFYKRLGYILQAARVYGRRAHEHGETSNLFAPSFTLRRYRRFR